LSLGNLLGYAVPILVGGAFTVFGIASLRESLRLVRHGHRVEAMFAGWEKREGWDHDDNGRSRKVTDHYAIFEFTDTIGREHRSVLTETGGTYTEGYPVEIFYDPEDPSKIGVATFSSLWGGAILGLSLGVPVMIFGFFLWYAGVPVKWN
jgi:hypothetical protein